MNASVTPITASRNPRTPAPISPALEIVDELRAGRMVILVDEEDRENEGDIVIAADHVTPEAINFMAKYGRGLICMPMTGERLDELDIPLMVNQNTARLGTAFCVTIEAKHSTSTGISATDRALTARVLADPAAGPASVTRPGHIFPLRAVNGGVRERPGHTEAAVDLCRLAGLEPVGVIAEVVYDDGEMMRLDGLRTFAAEHGCPLISIEDLVAYLEAGAAAPAESGTLAGRPGGEEEKR